MDIQAVWHKTTERVKDKVIHPTLWRALEVGNPITVEGDYFVVGFAPDQMHMSGHLNSSEHRNAIETSLAGYTGKKLRLLIIDGVTMEDWENFKARQRAAAESRERARNRATVEMAAVKSWDGVLEQMGRTYAAMNLRQLPQVRADYLLKSIEIISEAMDELYNDEAPDEPSQRALARVLDRVGTLTEVAPALVGYELLKYRRQKKQA